MPGQARDDIVLRCQLQFALGEAAGGAFGFACVAEDLAFEPVELMTGGEEAISTLIAYDDPGRIGADFDYVGIRHSQSQLKCGPITG